MKLPLIILLAGLLFLLPQNTNAYGGGGGLPLGFPPPSQVKLVCEYDIRIVKLPFNRTFTIKIPRCHVEMIKSQESDLKERLGDFWNRLKTGAK